MLFIPAGGPCPPARTPYEQRVCTLVQAWDAGQPAFPLHTSGSTGPPKPVALPRGQLEASARLTGHTFGLRPGQTALCCLSIDYIAGLMMLVRARVLKLHLLVAEPTASPLAAPGLPPIDFVALVPMQLQQALHEPAARARLAALHTGLLGGAGLPPALESELRTSLLPLFLTYGMTETASHVAIRPLGGPSQSDFFELLEGIEAATDGRGCLRVRGAVTGGHWLQTNDVVGFQGPRHFELLGRADAVINSGGVKIHPEAIERAASQVLADSGLAVRVLAAALPDARLGQQLVLLLETAPLADEAVFLEKLSDKLTRYQRPRRLFYLDAFAETATGKPDRRATVQKIRP